MRFRVVCESVLEQSGTLHTTLIIILSQAMKLLSC
jgi:hypothetical protein